MLKILDKIKSYGKQNLYIKPQKLVDIKRSEVTVEFISAGHPLYDNIVSTEEKKIRLLAPNDTAYDETSLLHNFVCITTYNNNKYLVINSFKHFKEQSIGGLLQFDENIYNIVPFIEKEEEYQTSADYTFTETYEYDHPVESYALIGTHNNKRNKLIINRGKTPINIRMIDEIRRSFTEKFSTTELELIDYVVIPSINTFISQKEKDEIIAS